MRNRENDGLDMRTVKIKAKGDGRIGVGGRKWVAVLQAGPSGESGTELG